MIILHEIFCSNIWFILYEILSGDNWLYCMICFAGTSDCPSWYFEETSDYTLWQTLQKPLIIFHEKIYKNFWLYFVGYFEETPWLYFIIYFGIKSDYTLSKTLQTLLIISHEIVCRNIWLYSWENLHKHLIILYGLISTKVWFYFMSHLCKNVL